MTKNGKLSQKWLIYMRNISCDRASAFGVRNPVQTVQKRLKKMGPLPNSGPFGVRTRSPDRTAPSLISRTWRCLFSARKWTGLVNVATQDDGEGFWNWKS